MPAPSSFLAARSTRSEELPAIYGQSNTLGVQALSQAFTTNPDGAIDEGAPDAAGITGNDDFLTNAQLAAQYQIYLSGNLPAECRRIYLEPGSVTDLRA